ncbi:MAG: PaaI family thioesterase [Actinomycetota bacterium]
MPARAPGAPAPGEVLVSHYRHCFGCGTDHPAGLHQRAIVGDGMDVATVVEITQAHQGAPGLAHGGVIATAMDEAMGVVTRLLRLPVVTVRLEVDYRRPVPVGTTLHIASRINGQRGRKVYTEALGHLDSPDGPIAVEAAALFLQVGLEHFLDHGNAEQLQEAIEERRRSGVTWEGEVNP